jgi:hypothetical protein
MTPDETEKPYGYDLEIQLNAGRGIIEKHFVGSESAVRRKAMMVSCAQKIISMKPLTRKQWVFAYGDPGTRHRFS